MWQRKEENRRFPFTIFCLAVCLLLFEAIRFLLLIRARSQKEVNRQRQFVRVSFFVSFFWWHQKTENKSTKKGHKVTRSIQQNYFCSFLVADFLSFLQNFLYEFIIITVLFVFFDYYFSTRGFFGSLVNQNTKNE